MKRPWAFICASEGATSKHLRNYCREVYLLGYLPVCPKLQDSQYLVLEDAVERSEYTAIVRDMLGNWRSTCWCWSEPSRAVTALLRKLWDCELRARLFCGIIEPRKELRLCLKLFRFVI